MSLPGSFYASFIFLLPLVFCNTKYNYPDKYSYLLATKLDAVSDNSSDYILPTNLKPFWYELFLSPDLRNGSFSGVVQIHFDVLSPTDVIVLHMNNKSLSLSDIPNLTAKQNLNVTSVTFDTVHEFVTFQLNNSLSIQTNASITIYFSGRLGSDMYGFYLSSYISLTKHLLAITQFESTFARRAFPCFDEPKYRANFTISILRYENQTTMSNMGLKSSQAFGDGTVMDLYDTTPAMPTYLVAFGVGDLVSISDAKNNRAIAREGVIQDASYALSIIQPILDKIGSFLDIQYPLKKIDVVAVPDFSAGAMENWGLTTYREKYVLYSQFLNTWRDKFGVLSVIAHEFGHQWFGDLVTPEWWDYAWLNEAFATYFEYTIPDQIEPTWNMGSSQYVMEAVQYALAKDTGSPRPMTSPVFTPGQIDNVFDYVIYEKGGSILRMTEYFLTTPVWRAGLKQYLTDNGYKTGTPDELFSALQSQSTELTNVKETLEGWTTQPGYPLITVVPTNSTNNSSGPAFSITQTPYAMNGTYSWNVPLTFTTQTEQQFNASKASGHWLLPSDNTTSFININETGWIIFNVDQVGFYRVNYDLNNWAKLRTQLQTNFTVIGSINRAQILDDAFHLGRTGHLDYHKVMGLTHYLPVETELPAWNAFFINMKYLMDQFQGTMTGDALMQYTQNLITTPFKSLMFNSTSSFNQALILQYLGSFACDIGLPACESLALYYFEQWRQNSTNNLLIPEVKQTILCTGLRKDPSFDAFKEVWNYYLKSNNGAEQLTVMNAMGCVSNESIISWYLDAACDTNASNVRLQDRWIVFRALASHQTGVAPVLHYMADNFDTVSTALGTRISAVMDALGHSVSQVGQITLVESLAKDPAVDSKLKGLLNSIVLPAVYKRQNWTESQPAASLKMWAHCYMSSSATPPAFSVYLIVASIAILYKFI